MQGSHSPLPISHSLQAFQSRIATTLQNYDVLVREMQLKNLSIIQQTPQENEGSSIVENLLKEHRKNKSYCLKNALRNEDMKTERFEKENGFGKVDTRRDNGEAPLKNISNMARNYMSFSPDNVEKTKENPENLREIIKENTKENINDGRGSFKENSQGTPMPKTMNKEVPKNQNYKQLTNNQSYAQTQQTPIQSPIQVIQTPIQTPIQTSNQNSNPFQINSQKNVENPFFPPSKDIPFFETKEIQSKNLFIPSQALPVPSIYGQLRISDLLQQSETQQKTTKTQIPENLSTSANRQNSFEAMRVEDRLALRDIARSMKIYQMTSEKQTKENQEIKEIPKISDNSRQLAEKSLRIQHNPDIIKRLLEDHKVSQLRQEKQLRKREKLEQNLYSFNPQIGMDAQNIKRTIEDLFQWDKNKKEKEEAIRTMHRMKEMEQIRENLKTSRVSQNSREILNNVGRFQFKEPIENRLLREGSKIQAKMRKLQKEATARIRPNHRKTSSSRSTVDYKQRGDSIGSTGFSDVRKALRFDEENQVFLNEKQRNYANRAKSINEKQEIYHENQEIYENTTFLHKNGYLENNNRSRQNNENIEEEKLYNEENNGFIEKNSYSYHHENPPYFKEKINENYNVQDVFPKQIRIYNPSNYEKKPSTNIDFNHEQEKVKKTIRNPLNNNETKENLKQQVIIPPKRPEISDQIISQNEESLDIFNKYLMKKLTPSAESKRKPPNPEKEPENILKSLKIQDPLSLFEKKPYLLKPSVEKTESKAFSSKNSEKMPQSTKTPAFQTEKNEKPLEIIEKTINSLENQKLTIENTTQNNENSENINYPNAETNNSNENAKNDENVENNNATTKENLQNNSENKLKSLFTDSKSFFQKHHVKSNFSMKGIEPDSNKNSLVCQLNYEERKKAKATPESLLNSLRYRENKVFSYHENRLEIQDKSGDEPELKPREYPNKGASFYEKNIEWLQSRKNKRSSQIEEKKEQEMRECSFQPNSDKTVDKSLSAKRPLEKSMVSNTSNNLTNNNDSYVELHKRKRGNSLTGRGFKTKK